MDGWNTIVSIWDGLFFRGYVSFGEGRFIIFFWGVGCFSKIPPKQIILKKNDRLKSLKRAIFVGLIFFRFFVNKKRSLTRY